MKPTEKRLGRIPAKDARDKKFPLSLVTPLRASVTTRYWRTGPVLDQGQFPHCVAYAWSQFIQSAPLMTPLPSPSYPRDLYARAQQLDEWDGEDYDGTSVRAGVKVLTEQQRVGTYLWTNKVEEARRFVLSRGSVVFGTWWTDLMFTPNKLGYIEPGGDIVGGHAYAVVGFSETRRAFRILNSWSRSWGENGRAWLHFDDAVELIEKDGEAECCSAVEIKIPLTQ